MRQHVRRHSALHDSDSPRPVDDASPIATTTGGQNSHCKSHNEGWLLGGWCWLGEFIRSRFIRRRTARGRGKWRSRYDGVVGQWAPRGNDCRCDCRCCSPTACRCSSNAASEAESEASEFEPRSGGDRTSERRGRVQRTGVGSLSSHGSSESEPGSTPPTSATKASVITQSLRCIALMCAIALFLKIASMPVTYVKCGGMVIPFRSLYTNSLNVTTTSILFPVRWHTSRSRGGITDSNTDFGPRCAGGVL